MGGLFKSGSYISAAGYVCWLSETNCHTEFNLKGTLLAIQKAVAHVLSSGLFVALNRRRQLALCSLLLEIGSSDPSTVSFVDVIRCYKH